MKNGKAVMRWMQMASTIDIKPMKRSKTMDYLATLIVFLLILLGVFLLCRELNCWYWKINRRIELLEEQNNNLKTIIEKLEGMERK